MEKLVIEEAVCIDKNINQLSVEIINWHFAVETMGSWSDEAIDFDNKVGLISKDRSCFSNISKILA